MENSSISILIAGAVLIIIALVSLGMLALNKSQSVVAETDTQFDMMSVSMHNDLFEEYSGTNLSYKEVKEIVAAVANNNFNVVEKGIGQKVLLTVGFYPTTQREKDKEPEILLTSEHTFFVDDVYDCITKNKYLSIDPYISRTYDCFVVKDTTRVNSVEIAKKEGVESKGRGIINEVVIVARNWEGIRYY